MTELVAEWLRKAEGDARTARREAHVKEGPNWDAVCFHAQQAVEKYLKAILQQENVAFTKTHDLSILLNSLLSAFPDLVVLSEDLEWLSAFAVEFRYPGEEAEQEVGELAVSVMERALGVLERKAKIQVQRARL
jgi:HEPN domain-containing protein